MIITQLPIDGILSGSIKASGISDGSSSVTDTTFSSLLESTDKGEAIKTSSIPLLRSLISNNIENEEVARQIKEVLSSGGSLSLKVNDSKDILENLINAAKSLSVEDEKVVLNNVTINDDFEKVLGAIKVKEVVLEGQEVEQKLENFKAELDTIFKSLINLLQTTENSTPREVVDQIKELNSEIMAQIKLLINDKPKEILVDSPEVKLTLEDIESLDNENLSEIILIDDTVTKPITQKEPVIEKKDNTVELKDNTVELKDNTVEIKDNTVELKDNVDKSAPEKPEAKTFSGKTIQEKPVQIKEVIIITEVNLSENEALTLSNISEEVKIVELTKSANQITLTVENKNIEDLSEEEIKIITNDIASKQINIVSEGSSEETQVVLISQIPQSPASKTKPITEKIAGEITIESNDKLITDKPETPVKSDLDTETIIPKEQQKEEAGSKVIQPEASKQKPEVEKAQPAVKTEVIAPKADIPLQAQPTNKDATEITMIEDNVTNSLDKQVTEKPQTTESSINSDTKDTPNTKGQVIASIAQVASTKAQQGQVKTESETELIVNTDSKQSTEAKEVLTSKTTKESNAEAKVLTEKATQTVIPAEANDLSGKSARANTLTPPKPAGFEDLVDKSTTETEHAITSDSEKSGFSPSGLIKTTLTRLVSKVLDQLNLKEVKNQDSKVVVKLNQDIEKLSSKMDNSLLERLNLLERITPENLSEIEVKINPNQANINRLDTNIDKVLANVKQLIAEELKTNSETGINLSKLTSAIKENIETVLNNAKEAVSNNEVKIVIPKVSPNIAQETTPKEVDVPLVPKEGRGLNKPAIELSAKKAEINLNKQEPKIGETPGEKRFTEVVEKLSSSQMDKSVKISKIAAPTTDNVIKHDLKANDRPQSAEPQEKTITKESGQNASSNSGNQNSNPEFSNKNILNMLINKQSDPALAGLKPGSVSTFATTFNSFSNPAAMHKQDNPVNQVIDHIRSSFNKSEISMSLKPYNLGNVNINISMQKGVMVAQIVAETAKAMTSLKSGIDSLRQTLVENGINVERIIVTQSDQTSHANNNNNNNNNENNSGQQKEQPNSNSNNQQNKPSNKDAEMLFDQFKQSKQEHKEQASNQNNKEPSLEDNTTDGIILKSTATTEENYIDTEKGLVDYRI